MLSRGAIYAIINMENGRYYIGSAADYVYRWRTHRSQLQRGAHPNPRLQASYNKHGGDAFWYCIVERVTDRSELLPREQFHLDRLRPYLRHGYNVYKTAGSPAGHKHSEESRRRRSVATMGRKFSPETCAKISVALTGKHLSEEHKEKVRRANIGKKYSAEVSARKAAVLRQHCVISEEAKRRRIASFKATIASKVMTAEERARRSQAQMGKKLSPETIRKRERTRAENRALRA